MDAEEEPPMDGFTASLSSHTDRASGDTGTIVKFNAVDTWSIQCRTPWIHPCRLRSGFPAAGDLQL